jgi:hypothetical protein
MADNFRRDQARFPSTKPKGSRIVLAETHKAIVNSETLFPTRVFHATQVKRILKSGHNSPKTGRCVEKGAWTGADIYTLTLEERHTCSPTCLTWSNCYGNNMQYAERIMNDPVFESRLWAELQALQDRHPDGFVTRLHILGDFYSVPYVVLWRDALLAFSALRIFGYTGRPRQSEIGLALAALNREFPERCRIRFSGTADGGEGSLVIKSEAESRHVICPAQTDKTACCATCAFCWTSSKTVEFLEH